MLAAAAARLAAIEALCPTAALLVETDAPVDFPTLAGSHVYDSRQITVDELDQGVPWTPTLSVYTEDIGIGRRGNAAPSVSGEATMDLVVVVELSRHSSEATGEGVEIVEDGDPKARLVLEALCAQVRKALLHAPRGSAFRYVVGSIERVGIQSFGLPQYGMRLMCSVMTFSCAIRDDKFTDDGGLPSPMKEILAGLPDQSYARGKLTELAAAFLATNRAALEGIDLHARTGNGHPALTVPPS